MSATHITDHLILISKRPHPVKQLCAAGGSVADEEVVGAANGYGMTMVFSGLRLFHH